jgi:3-oxoacyl-[acyl-carrier protein] reductase
MELGLRGRRVLVTGGSKGIGLACAEAFAAEGCDIVLAARDAAALEAAAAGLRARHNVGVAVHAADLSDAAAREGLAAAHADVDVLVNNAGGSLGQTPRPIEDVTDADWDRILAINLDAVFALCRAVVPQMKRSGRGRIITVSSRAGSNASLHGVQAYTAAKHAVNGLTRQLASDLGPYGITVNGVAPGLVLTNPARDRQWASYGETAQRAMLDRIGLRRLGTAEEVAKVVAFLASDLASFVNGVVIPVDGGHA